jgi:ACT domain-containing protein
MMRKIVITVVGKDSVGIIAKVCSYLADSRINILDISQTIVDGFFNMMMIVDTASGEKDFDTLAAELDEVGKELGCIIHAQREEIFDQMHRI